MCSSSLLYSARRVSSPPVIDGDISEFLRTDSIELLSPTDTLGNYYFLWDDSALYIAAEVSDEYLNSNESRDGSLWDDDSIELFFDTLHNVGSSRGMDDYKFFVNLLNVQRDSQGVTGKSWDMSFDSDVLYSGSLNDNSDIDSGYFIEIAIPWSAWGVSVPSKGDVWGFDLSMNDEGAGNSREYVAWANVDDGTMNNPAGWGDLVFASRVLGNSKCSSGADNSGDSSISISELLNFIISWKSGSVSINELLTGIVEWKRGCG
jgi:hypothetical protein